MVNPNYYYPEPHPWDYPRYTLPVTEDAKDVQIKAQQKQIQLLLEHIEQLQKLMNRIPCVGEYHEK